MAWLSRSLGDSVSSLTGQLSNLTKDILTEGTEEVSDHATELSLAKEKIASLESIHASQRTENERLKVANRELEEKAESAELQINSISREYRTLLEEKEKEINTLKQHHHELLEQHAKVALHASGDTTPVNSFSNTEFQEEGFGGWSNESWGEYDDSLRLQREVNSLRQEVTRLQADSQHWRSVAGQLSHKGGQDGDQTAQHDIFNLQAKVKELEKKVSESREQAQHEVASLQDVHQSKMATLKKRHKDEITEFKSQMSSLEQQLADARDGDSARTGGNSVLPESERAESELERTLKLQLQVLTQEHDRVQAAKAHLEGVLQELQVEVETLQMQRDEHLAKISQLEASMSQDAQNHQHQLQALQAQLKDAESWRVEAEQNHQQVGLDLVHAKHCLLDHLEANHADTADLLSEVRCVRQQLSSEAVRRQCRLMTDKQNLANRLYTVGVQEAELKSNIIETGTQLQQVTADTEELIEKLQDEESQKQAAEILNSLERENLVLKEQSLKQQEQITLLEKRLVTEQLERDAFRDTNVSLKQELKLLRGEMGSDSDNTLDQSITTLSTAKSDSAAASQPSNDDEVMDWQMQKEALEDVLAQLRQEIHEKDEHISDLSSGTKPEDSSSQAEVTSLREENQRLQSQLASVQDELSAVSEEKGELETSISELDEQHQEATNHLIAARTSLQSQLTESQQQVKKLQDELQNLSQQQKLKSLEPPQSSDDMTASLEQIKLLQQQLHDTLKEINTLKQQAEAREGEMADLKVKLQKGTLALNDLHMDKKDLEEELATKQEEIKAKVAAIKTLREEKSKLAGENRELVSRIQELEDEVDAWEQRNEESQMSGPGLLDKLQEEETERLKTEVSELQSERSLQSQKLDTMFAELDDFRATCRKLQQEKEDLGLELVKERDAALDRVAELEMGLTANSVLKEELSELHSQSEFSSSASNSKEKELEELVSDCQQQISALSKEKAELQEELKGCQGENISNISDLKTHHQWIRKALQKRNDTMKRDLNVWLKNSGNPKSDSDLKEESSVGQGVLLLELFAENRTIMDAVCRGNAMLEDIQQQSSCSPASIGSTPSQESSSQSTIKDSHYDFIQEENERLMSMVMDDECEISDLKKSLENLQQGNSASRVSERMQSLETQLLDRNSEVEMLRTENAQLMQLCEQSKSRLEDSRKEIESLKCQLQSAEDLVILHKEELTRHNLIEKENASSSHQEKKLEEELDLARDKIQQLEKDLENMEEELSNCKVGIEDFNAKYAEASKSLQSAQDSNTQLENHNALLRQNSIEAEEKFDLLQAQFNHAVSYLSAAQCRIVLGDHASVSHVALPALDYPEKPALEMKSDKVEELSVENGEVEEWSVSKQSQMSEKHAELVRQLEGKSETIADLQQNNTALLQMLEARSLTSGTTDNMQVDNHRLQDEVKALKVEKEQIIAVMNDKSREASSLKAEVMRLMSVISAEKSALEKLQKDNQELQLSRSSPPRDDSLDDMTREAMQNLSRLVRDREVEIEALKQKNETLMAVLQDMSQQGDGGVSSQLGTQSSSLASVLADKENLEKQLATLQAEREQMVAFLNQKHSESMTYHAEIQRLTALRAAEVESYDKLRAEHDALCPQFEDNKQSLLKLQNDFINYRQKHAELEVRYGELLQRSNASDTVDAASFHEIEEEKDRLLAKQVEIEKVVQTSDEKLRTTTERLNEVENALKGKDAEASTLKKQVDSLHFQLQSLKAEAADLKQEQLQAQHSQEERQSHSQLLREQNNQLTLAVREKEFEVSSLQERLTKLTALVSEQQGEKTQVTQLLRDQEAASNIRAGLQQEVDQLTLSLKQKQQQLSDMQAENLKLKEKEQKLSRELDRLRSHLLQIEEGYTREALEAEEREKNLRNRLAEAEDQLMSSASRVQSASQQATQQVENLQQQLHSIASQRDSAYMQVASLQEQSQQYASSLSNLQLVLEQFQREKESQIASEIERYQDDACRLKEKISALEKELLQTKEELAEAVDGLAAASRLSEQLDRKEEALAALRDEVQHRENALKAAEEEIHKLTSSKEAKVDRELMRNLLLGYFHTPNRNRMDAIHAIGSVLGFTPDDFHKIEESQGGGWMSSIFGMARTPGATPPTTPGRPPKGPNQSFSQLFVKFLEVESTPPPAPVRLPAEEMAREAQERHHMKDHRDKPAFNPFTAPRHVSMPITVGAAAMAASSSSSSHLLMSPPSPGSPTSSFPVFAPFTSPVASSVSSPHNSSSAILKDVLGSS